jgi:hypothetical protein
MESPRPVLPEYGPRFNNRSESAALRIGKSKLRRVWTSALSRELTGDARFRSTKSTKLKTQRVRKDIIKKNARREERELEKTRRKRG